MTDIDPTSPAPPPSPHRLPRDTTPTWEVELLISGVAVFAMLQLPGLLDDWLFAMTPRFADDWHGPLVMAYAYGKSFALILAVTFSLHLLLRARWIALVGMHSVYPAGIAWERLRMGPIQRAVERARYGDAASTIDRADNRSTIVFAFGVMLASMLLLILLVLGCLFAAVVTAIQLLGLDVAPSAAFVMCSLLAMAPAIVAHHVDRRFGARLRDGGHAQRLLARVFSVYAQVGLLGRGSNPTLALLSSHGGERRAMIVTSGLTMVVMATVGLGYVAMSDPQSLGNYARFPVFADGRRTVDAAHYDDQRNPARDPAVPYIRSAIAIGPYLRLVVPYQPERRTDTSHAACPTAETLHGDALADARLACLQRRYAVLMDDAPLPTLQYDLGSDDRTDRPALVAMIDVRALPSGRHELRVMHAPRDGDAAVPGVIELRAPHDADKTDDRVLANRGDRIPFWR